MRNHVILSAVLLAFTASCQATATVDSGPGSDPDNNEEVWVTIGSDALGTLESELSSGILDTRQNAEGVTVVKVPGDVIPELSHVMHTRFKRCGGFFVHDSQKQATGSLDNALSVSAITKAFAGYSIDNGQVADALITEVEESNLVSSITTLSSYQTRYYTSQSGVDAALWIRDQFQLLAQNRPDITVETYQHAGYPQPSVIVTIPGDSLPDEVVVIGGHLDSTAFGSSSAPGADDDASGIATLIEMMRVIATTDYKPDRTVKLIGYAAEEVGLRGSGDIADSFQSQGVNVVGVMQLDMTNYKGSSKDIWLVDDYTNAEQNQFIGQLIDAYLNLTWDYTTCGYACSDHASWTQAGYPASLPFESRIDQYNPEIHTGDDTIDVSGGSAEHAAKFARLAAAYLAELAKGDFTGGGEPPPPPPPPPPVPDPVTETFSGSLSQGAQDAYGPFEVTGGTTFTADITGTGDADLYVHIGAPPTTSTYTCRPYRNGSAENCTVDVPAGQSEVHIMLRGYSSATYDLVVNYTPKDGGGDPPPPPPPPGEVEVTETFNDSVARLATEQYGPFIVVPGSDLTAVLSPDNGSSGDADLYVRFDAAPTTGSYDCRPYLNGSNETCQLGVPAGTTEAFVMVRGYNAAEYQVDITYTTPQP